MTDNYPIVTEKSLRPAKRSRMRRARRVEGEVPPVKGEQVRVFLVDGKHVVDHGRRDDLDPQVVRASHVAVVDLSRNVEVSVRLNIPSQDAQEFTVQVTFLCTVTDPVAVVRNGQGDASRSLLGYVRCHQRLFQLGLDHEISAINRLRLLVQTQIEAYVQLRPPVLPGLVAGLANVDVLTPESVRARQGEISKQADEHTIEKHGLTLQHEMDRLREEHARQLKVAQTKHEAQMEELRRVLQEQTQRTMAAQIDFMDRTVDDPVRATVYAELKGELSATDVAAKIQEEAEREEARERDELTRRRGLEDEERLWLRQRADREYDAELAARQRAYTVEDGDRARALALDEARERLELKRLEHLQALEGGDREHDRAMIERAFEAEERERERLHELEGRTLELETEKTRLDHEANQAKLRLLYEERAADVAHRHAVEDREHRRAVEREIRAHELERDLLEARLTMFKEYAARGHVDQAVISPRDVLDGLSPGPAAGAAVVAGGPALPDTGSDAGTGQGGQGAVEDDDEPLLREEGT